MQEVLKKTIEDARTMTSKVNPIYYILLSLNSRLTNSSILFRTIAEISATREIGHPEDSPRSFGFVKRRRDDCLSDGTSATRRHTSRV